MKLLLISFNEQLHRDAAAFRRKKIREFLDKPIGQRTEMEESILRTWISHYGKRIE
tara:strand:+ start:607 stop:774 length:168 start_codon:yes stop_codon:yes gene_type:complete